MAEEEQKTEEKKPEEKKKKINIRDVTDQGAKTDKELRYTKRFVMDWIDDETGETRSGEFTIKRPTLGETARIGTMMAELREDRPASSLDRSTFALHEWIATCSVVVTSAPPWFKPQEMFDEDPLMRVYAEALAFQQSFRKKSVG